MVTGERATMTVIGNNIPGTKNEVDLGTETGRADHEVQITETEIVDGKGGTSTGTEIETAKGTKTVEAEGDHVRALFKKPFTVKPKKGCRCGNATATPGKLTCCGQRCPCYVDSKACLECKCRGCRNPHRVDGQKGEYGKFCCNKPEIKMETTPAACGEAIEVPFINWEYLNVKLGTEVMAPPGAHIWTPTPPSIVGPLEDHVYGEPERRFEGKSEHSIGFSSKY
ncbi:unnamed protein product [Callosobruchus maculatus]|uniref:CXC MSL2-type domain-containing protein n=1 Tax=Callosobruchus maculatus TaxID=64391 RepID=A0A653D2R9_CALMS|nr:unnamed protein product [Callosobruchus maculatus]